MKKYIIIIFATLLILPSIALQAQTVEENTSVAFRSEENTSVARQNGENSSVARQSDENSSVVRQNGENSSVAFRSEENTSLARQNGENSSVSRQNEEKNDERVAIESVNITGGEAEVVVEFVMGVKQKAAPRNYAVVMVPTLTLEGYTQSLPAIVIQGKNVKSKISRYEWVSGQKLDRDETIYVNNGETIDYKAVLPSHPWMERVDLVVESFMVGCCDNKVIAEMLSAKGVNPWGSDDPENGENGDGDPENDGEEGSEGNLEGEGEEGEEGEETQEPPKTLSETISAGVAYLADISEFDESKATQITEEERESPLAIYFRQGSSVIENGYKDNSKALVELTRLIEMIMSDADHDVGKITVSGFSSPEGSIERNNILATERAMSVKKHILSTTDMADEDISVYNGSVDWDGLRSLVANSDMKEKNQIIDIIDNVPVWDSRTQRGRTGELMRLNAGETYKQLMQDYFPLLRSGAFIKIYYK